MNNIQGNKLSDIFIIKNLMGPNVVKITDELTSDLVLQKGMKVLDLGCGKGLSAFYIAQKFNVTVYATDLWIDPSDNYKRAKEVGLENLIIPLRVDANNIPFADEYFDVVISIDAYHYFGTKACYLDNEISRILKPGGVILMASPGIKNEFEGNIPNHLTKYGFEKNNFHSCTWWEELWNESATISDIKCGEIVCHEEAWHDWLNTEDRHAIDDRLMIADDNGICMNHVFLKGRKK